MNQNYTKAIKAIINFKKIFDKIDPKTPKKLVGDVGEFYALKKLEKLGLEPEHKGGQGGYDIFLKKINKKLKLELHCGKMRACILIRLLDFGVGELKTKIRREAKNLII